jgi:hypothetical protein
MCIFTTIKVDEVCDSLHSVVFKYAVNHKKELTPFLYFKFGIYWTMLAIDDNDYWWYNYSIIFLWEKLYV